MSDLPHPAVSTAVRGGELRYNGSMVQLKFTIHMQMRVAERSINIDHVKAAIKNPDLTTRTVMVRWQFLRWSTGTAS